MPFTEIERKVQEQRSTETRIRRTKRNNLTEKKKLKDESSRKQGFAARNHGEVQGCELRGKENLEWNTDLIETKLENVICQATQGLYSDEEQHESREADVHDDEQTRVETKSTRACPAADTTCTLALWVICTKKMEYPEIVALWWKRKRLPSPRSMIMWDTFSGAQSGGRPLGELASGMPEEDNC